MYHCIGIRSNLIDTLSTARQAAELVVLAECPFIARSTLPPILREKQAVGIVIYIFHIVTARYFLPDATATVIIFVCEGIERYIILILEHGLENITKIPQVIIYRVSVMGYGSFHLTD